MQNKVVVCVRLNLSLKIIQNINLYFFLKTCDHVYNFNLDLVIQHDSFIRNPCTYPKNVQYKTD